MEPFAAVLLAGGAGSRMGGLDKPGMTVAGRPMRERVLDAVADADPRIVVGPAVELPAGVLLTREDPPGGGPVAATAAGLARLDREDFDRVNGTVALLAADLPLITPAAIIPLRRALAASGADGACYLDHAGRRQRLCGVWRAGALRRALDRLCVDRNGDLTGASMGALQAGLAVTEVTWAGSGPPPWFDCDTDEDLRRAQEWCDETA